MTRMFSADQVVKAIMRSDDLHQAEAMFEAAKATTLNQASDEHRKDVRDGLRAIKTILARKHEARRARMSVQKVQPSDR